MNLAGLFDALKLYQPMKNPDGTPTEAASPMGGLLGQLNDQQMGNYRGNILLGLGQGLLAPGQGGFAGALGRGVAGAQDAQQNLYKNMMEKNKYDREGKQNEFENDYHNRQLAQEILNQNRNFGLDTQKLANQKYEFGKDQGYKYNALDVNKDQFAKDLDYKNRALTANSAIAGARYSRDLLPNAGKPLTPENAQKVASKEQAIKNLDEAAGLLFDEAGNLNKGNLLNSNIPLGFTNVALPIGGARDLRNNFKTSIETMLRSNTGAAAPASEVDNYMDMYYPSPFDSPELMKKKISNLREVMGRSNDLSGFPVTPPPAVLNQSNAPRRPLSEIFGQ